jgi:nucleoside-diphosphate-sugar epimerase
MVTVSKITRNIINNTNNTNKKLVSVVLFGASGYVGQSILRELVERTEVGEIIAISRNINSNNKNNNKKITYLAADAMKPEMYLDKIKHAKVLITSVGALPFGITAEECFRRNADTNIVPAKSVLSKNSGETKNNIDRFISSAIVPGLKPYIEGKRAVEKFASEEFAKRGERLAVVVKPGGVSGKKAITVSGMNINLPLWIAMDPMSFILKRFGNFGIENSPVRVERVAKAVVNAAISNDERFIKGGYLEISNKEIITNSEYDF